ncbi:MAG: C10 family peptidase [Bacteroidota bacterium]
MNKYYKSLSFLAFILFTLSVFAARVDVQTAQKLATNFYFEKCIASGIATKSPAQQNLVFTKFAENTEIYYVFAAQIGFVIIAADDAVYPVLGYSFEGNFNSGNVSPEYSFWMDSYEKQILYIKENHLNASTEISNLWNEYTAIDFTPNLQKSSAKSVEPLLMSTWDQGAYYNFLCPEDVAGPDRHVWSGCVATAMAQVMYYYRYPQHGTGSYGYNSNYGYLTADFGNTTYAWDAMQNSIGSKYNFEMAQLQSHCGIAIDMNYDPTGSGAYMNDDVSALKNYFGYSSSTQLYNKSSYTATAWETLLKGNLDQKMPIQYSGFGDGGGHAFVCDGYQGTNYFHFNWGWSGSYNGYFYVNNLNPGYLFNDGQQAILNSYPATGFPQNCSGQKILTSAYGTIEDGSSPLYNYQNNLDCFWLIAPTDVIDYIRLNFERIETESANDIITIYDGETTNDPVLGVFSGNTIPAEVVSTGNKMLVRFTTNGTNVAQGWLLTYNSKPTSFCSNMLELTTPNGTISDGSDTNNYNNNTFCHWRISLPIVSGIAINFTSFNLANDEDFVKIYDETANSEVAAFTNASPPQSLMVYTNKVLILFKTNGLNPAAGWDLTYSSSPLSVEENEHTALSVFPNPVSDILKIEASLNHDDLVTIQLINALGETVGNYSALPVDGSLNESIPLNHLPQGIYFLKLSSATCNHFQKIIIQ